MSLIEARLGDGVTVGMAYAYEAGDLDLEVGDRVLVPPSYVDKLNGRHGAQVATVAHLGSEYDGPVKPVLGRAS